MTPCNLRKGRKIRSRNPLLVAGLCTLGFLLVFSGCKQNPSQKSVIADVRQTQTIVLRKLPSQKHVHAMAIRITGKISGDASIQLFDDQSPKEDGSAYHEVGLSGPVNVSWQHDWYGDEAKVVYTPLNVSNGNVEIQYHFED
jgi:hypothetical protein